MILVTGSTGFLGSRLMVQLIENGYLVRGLKRAHSKIPEILIPYAHKIHWVDGDVLDISSLEEAMVGADYLFHCAAFVSLNQRKTQQLYKVNITGTANVVNACLGSTIKKICHVSSIASLGNPINGEEIDEKHQWTDSESAYSNSKFFSENEVWRGMAEGLEAVIVNPAVIIGPGTNEYGSGRIIKLFRNGTRFYTNGSIAFVDVRDVVNCMIQLMFSEVKNERFIISSGNYSYKKLLEIAAAITKNKSPKVLLSKNTLTVFYYIAKFFSLLTFTTSRINKSNIDSAADSIYYSNQKIKKALNYEFIPIEKTINDSIYNIL